jgi:hypothetical protein
VDSLALSDERPSNVKVDVSQHTPAVAEVERVHSFMTAFLNLKTTYLAAVS